MSDVLGLAQKEGAPLPPLADTLWEFGRSDGSVICVLGLQADGSISGTNSVAEHRWGIEDGKLNFFGKDNRVTTCFSNIGQEQGRPVLSGAILLSPGPLLHRLRGLGRSLNSDTIRRDIPEIIAVSLEEIRIHATPRVMAALDRLHLYTGRLVNRFAASDVVIFPVRGALEPYACIAAGHAFCSMGAFSYTESPVLWDMRIGRYCSIAAGLEIFGPRHPVEWATTSSITYDVHPGSGYRSFLAAHQNLGGGDFPPDQPPGLLEPVPSLGHDVWIGQNVQLARGITIGTGAVIAAGAIVTRDVPPYAIVAGIPARILRYRFSEAVITGLLASEWWRYGPGLLKQADYRHPASFVDHVAAYRGPMFEPGHVSATDLVDAVIGQNPE